MQQRFQLVRRRARAVAFGLPLNDTARYIVGIDIAGLNNGKPKASADRYGNVSS
ncbi:MAG: hypothetical protein RIC55_16580 [Pirellulaceae bacterium]